MKKHYRRLFTVTCAILFSMPFAIGQQNPMYTNYNMNSMVFNPAYAGSNEHLTLSLLHRTQWVGMEGAPSTQMLGVHTPLRFDPVGVGLSITRDKIGPTGTLDINTAYAYRIKVSENAKLSLGLSVSISNWRSQFNNLLLEDSGDDAFATNTNVWLPNFGGGVYFYSKNFYAGISVPKLVEHDLRQEDNIDDPVNAKIDRHFYFNVGTVFPIGDTELKLRPSLLIRQVGILSGGNSQAMRIGAPTGMDLGIGLFFSEIFSAGVSWRTAVELPKSSSDSFDTWVAFNLRNGLRLAAGYDAPFQKSGLGSVGSLEAMIGYEFDVKVSRVASIRYF